MNLRCALARGSCASNAETTPRGVDPGGVVADSLAALARRRVAGMTPWTRFATTQPARRVLAPGLAVTWYELARDVPMRCSRTPRTSS